jgi:hypothetical protein
MSKLAIRGDQEARVIRAYFSKLDDTDRIEIATLSMNLAEQVPGLFERWVVVIRDAYKTAFEACR